jgi:hypothetical protein
MTVRRIAWSFVALAAIAYAVTLAMNISYAAGGADSSGYMNEARLLASGRTRAVIEPLRTLKLDSSFIQVFTPLGFTWGPPNSGTMSPGYPPGLPLHLAIAGLLGGWTIAPFLVSPLAAIGAALLMYAVGRQFGLTKPLVVAGAFLLALLPQTISHAVQPVSDVLATFWSLVAMLFALRSRENAKLAFLAGVAYAISVCVRPTNVLLLIPLALAVRVRFALLVRIAIGAAPIAIALALYQNDVYGSPFRTGYGTVAEVVFFERFIACLKVYLRYTLTVGAPIILPLGLFIVFHRRIDGWTRALLPVWFAVFFLFYCLWAPYDDWWITRFLLPGIPGLIVGTLLLLQSIKPKIVTALIVVILLAAPAYLSHHHHVLFTNEIESIYPEVTQWAAAQLPPNAIILVGQMSGAWYYYTGTLPARPDQLEHDRFQLLRAYAGSAGKKWYALLSGADMNIDELRKRCPGDWQKMGELRGVTLWRLDS